MRGRKSLVVVDLTDLQRVELKRILRSRVVKAGLQKRARAVLAIADGMTFRSAANVVGITDRNLRKWCRRFLEQGIDGLNDRPGRGRKPSFSPDSRRADRQACV
jgi:transposase